MKCVCGSRYLIESVHPDYMLCRDCGSLISIIPRLTCRYDFVGVLAKHVEERSVLDFYDRIPFWYKEIKKIPLKKSLLEIGCSHGGFLKYCSDRGFSRCVGIELTEGACQYARDTFGVEMICGDFPNTVVEESFDIVCAFDMIEHTEDPLQALKKMAEIGKYVMVQVPFYSEEKVEEFPYFDAGIHLFLPSEKAIEFMFKESGMKIISSVPGAFQKNLTIIGEVI